MNVYAQYGFMAGIGPIRVLVAEDNLANQQLLAAILQTLGVAADYVANGAAAVAAADQAQFDLVFMDISMPVMDGLTAIRRIRAAQSLNGRRAAIIYILSSQCGPRDLLASEAAGADGHLSKPIDVTRVLEAVWHAVSARAAGGGPLLCGPTARGPR